MFWFLKHLKRIFKNKALKQDIMAEKTNVILIVMDTARYKNFPFYSYKKNTAPNLTALLKDSVLYTDCYSTSPWTLPSHASLFSGQYVSSHGCNEKNKYFSPDVSTLPEVLEENGYETIAVSSNSWISPAFGFGRGFKSFSKVWQIFQTESDFTKLHTEHSDKPAVTKILIGLRMLFKDFFRNVVNAVYEKFLYKKYDYGARRANKIAKSTLRKAKSPFFLFINYLEPHLKYLPPRNFRRFLEVPYPEAMKINQDAWKYVFKKIEMPGRDFEILEQLYDCEIFYLDYRIGELIDFLKKAGAYDNSMVIITSDHGENIGDHNMMDHQYCLYNTLLKVPLIIKYPQELNLKNKKNNGLVQLNDIFPTILDALKIKNSQSKSIQGTSLLSGRKREFGFAEYLWPQPKKEAITRHLGTVDFSPFEHSLVSVFSKKYKLIERSDGRDEMYNLEKDSSEKNNIIHKNKKPALALKHRMRQFKKGIYPCERDKI